MKQLTQPVFKLLTTIQAYAIKLAKNTIHQQCERYVQQLIDSVEDEQKKQVLAEIMKIQLHSSVTQGKYVHSRNNDLDTKLVYTNERNELSNRINVWLKMAFNTASNIYDQYRPLVGIQPLRGPCGFMYMLKYKAREDSDIMSLEIVSQAVEARTMKLEAKWRWEDAQEMNALYNVDLVNELSYSVGLEVCNSYGQFILNNVRKYAKFNESVDCTNSAAEKLVCVINSVSNKIGQETRRGCGNVLYMNPSVIAYLQSNDLYTQLQQQYTIKPDLGCEVNEIIVGYKGRHGETKGRHGETDAGMFLCPYVMLVDGGIQINTETFQPVQTLMTRFAYETASTTEDVDGNTIKAPNPYYGVITVNLPNDQEDSEKLEQQELMESNNPQ